MQTLPVATRVNPEPVVFLSERTNQKGSKIGTRIPESRRKIRLPIGSTFRSMRLFFENFCGLNKNWNQIVNKFAFCLWCIQEANSSKKLVTFYQKPAHFSSNSLIDSLKPMSFIKIGEVTVSQTFPVLSC